MHLESDSYNIESVSYRGKQYTIPVFSANDGIRIFPRSEENKILIPDNSPVLDCLNETFNLNNFKVARKPVSLGVIDQAMQNNFSQLGQLPRTLDMPIKFPGSEFRLPAAFAQFADLVQLVANYEAAINKDCFDEYYCYMTVDRGFVEANSLQREAPCHVDGFQGARWQPKLRNNHTYVIGDTLPTAYYVQPFDFDFLDESRHNFFWEMNRQVALTNSQFVWQPEPYELVLMDCYCVHRGVEAVQRVFRTWVRLSFEVRIFDRLGNAHNPLFSYDWPMVPRDVEELQLEAFDPQSDPSLRVFPWQDLEGNAHADKLARTKPNLKPGQSDS